MVQTLTLVIEGLAWVFKQSLQARHIRRAIELLNAADFSPQTYAGAIINLTDTGSEGRWRWVSGQPVTYSNWPMSLGRKISGIQ